MNVDFSPLHNLSATEKMDLIDALWSSVAASPENLPTWDWQKEELDRRIAEHQANPDDAVPWETVKAQLRRRDA